MCKNICLTHKLGLTLQHLQTINFCLYFVVFMLNQRIDLVILLSIHSIFDLETAGHNVLWSEVTSSNWPVLLLGVSK